MKQVKELQLGDQVALKSDVDPKLHQSAAAPVFDATQDYPAGYHVTYNGYLYRFTSAHAAGAWTGNDVVAENMTTPDAMLDLTSAGFLRVVSADGTILWMQNALSASRNEIAADFSASTAYAPPALVVYNGVLYRCSTAHPAGAWDATHFTAATVQDVLAIINQRAEDAYDLADTKVDKSGDTMTGTFRLKGVLKVDTGDITTYELDYYGIRIYVNGVTKQIYMPPSIPLADSGYMALVENLAPGFSTSATYYKDDLVKYNGTLYMCMATSHTGAWSNSDFAMASVQGALARKLGHEGPWVNGYIDVLERVTGESVPYGVRIYRDKIVYGAFTNTTPRGFTPIRTFNLPTSGGTLALQEDVPILGISVNGTLQPATNKVVDIPVPVASTSTPNPDGTGSPGSASFGFSCGNHVHPSDSTKLNKSGGTMTGDLTVTQDIVLSRNQYNSVRLTGQLDQTGSLWPFLIMSLGFDEEEQEPRLVTVYLPRASGTIALTAGTGHEGNLAALDANGNPTDAGWKAGDLARYALSTKTITSGAVSLDDRAINSVDATSAASVVLNFPDGTIGKARDFMMVLDCGATPPTLAYGSYITIYAEDDDALVPEEGRNIYMFTETSTNRFFAARKLVDKVVEQNAASPDQLMDALASAGIDTSTLNTPGQMAAAVGLSESSATFGQILGKV